MENDQKLEKDGPDTAEEKTAVSSEVNADPSMYVHEFKTPFKFEGKTYKTLNFDFGKLKGKDMVAIENEMLAMNEVVLMPEISTSYHCHLAARASGVGADVIGNMPILEFKKITNAARDFLVSTGY